MSGQSRGDPPGEPQRRARREDHRTREDQGAGHDRDARDDQGTGQDRGTEKTRDHGQDRAGGDAEDGWIPVETDAARQDMRHGPSEDAMLREFLQAPEGELREGSLVVRPSMRAALGRVVTAFLVITPFFLPVAIGAAADGFESRDGGLETENLWILVADVAGNLIIPFLVSLAPALQLAFTRYVLDDEGIRERMQLLSRTDKRIRWGKVTALQHRRTALDRILGIERIDVVAYGKRGTTLHLIGLREAPYIRDMVARQMRAQASVAGMLRND